RHPFIVFFLVPSLLTPSTLPLTLSLHDALPISILRGDSKYYRNGLQSSINHVSTNSRFKVNLTTVFNTDKSDLSNPVTGAGASVLLPPNFQTRLPDGELNWMLGANVEASNLSRNESLSNNFIGNFSASYKFLPNIEIKINGGY